MAKTSLGIIYLCSQKNFHKFVLLKHLNLKFNNCRTDKNVNVTNKALVKGLSVYRFTREHIPDKTLVNAKSF